MSENEQQRLRTVLVATDFSAAASGALEHAGALARETGAELRVVHAVVPGSDEVLEHDRGQAATAERLQGHVVSVLGADRVVEMVVRAGNAAEVILAQAAEAPAADLIVMGASGMSRWKRLLLGGTARRVLEHARCPVLLVHAGDVVRPRRQPRRVLAAMDFSAGSRTAMRRAVGLLEISPADTLVLAHAFYFSPAVSFAVMPMSRLELEGLVRQEAARELEQEAGPLRAAGLAPAPAVLEGRAAPALAQAASDLHADFIVAGAIGRGGVPHLLLGSTAERLAEQAPCPVLVVPAAAAEPAPAAVEASPEAVALSATEVDQR